jgi:hypothetical protein
MNFEGSVNKQREGWQQCVPLSIRHAQAATLLFAFVVTHHRYQQGFVGTCVFWFLK